MPSFGFAGDPWPYTSYTYTKSCLPKSSWDDTWWIEKMQELDDIIKGGGKFSVEKIYKCLSCKKFVAEKDYIKKMCPHCGV